MTPRIYRYIVDYDGGTAPNPFGGWCTLAICKPRIRTVAAAGDWIIGLRKHRNDHVVYVMQIEDSLTFAKYWKDRRFAVRRPGRSQFPDNFYRPNAIGKLDYVENHVHGPECAARDLSGHRVLISRTYWYFGTDSPRISTDLEHLVHRTQGHVVRKRRREDDVVKLKKWLQHWPPGLIGQPIDAEQSSLQSRNRPTCNTAPKRSRPSC